MTHVYVFACGCVSLKTDEIDLVNESPHQISLAFGNNDVTRKQELMIERQLNYTGFVIYSHTLILVLFNCMNMDICYYKLSLYIYYIYIL